MEEFKIGSVLDNAWELSKKHGIWMCLMLLVIYIINNALQGAFCMGDTTALVTATQSGDPMQVVEAFGTVYNGNGLAIFLCEVVALCFAAGFLNTALLIARGKMEKVDLSGFRVPVMAYVKYLLVSILLVVIAGIGTAFCVIPGIWLFVRLMMSYVAVIDDPEIPFFDAFRKSWAITRGHFWKLLGLGILIILINFVGVCCCCIGVLFTMVISEFALATAYIILSDNAEPAEPAAEPVVEQLAD